MALQSTRAGGVAAGRHASPRVSIPDHDAVRRFLAAGDAFLEARNLKQPPTDALTFEAWIRTGDDCADGTLLSYAVDSRRYPRDKAADNEFVLFATRGLMVCRGFQWYRHPSEDACEHYFAEAGDRNFADGRWHHVAATWTAANNGSVTIYKDGLLVARAETGKTERIPPGGVWMLGAEQDCVGGCVDPSQTFHGAMDDVRLWRTARTQGQILRSMFDSEAIRSGADAAGLVFFLDFDGDVFSDTVRDVGIAHNDLPLRRPPTFTDLLALPAGAPGAPPQLVPVHAGADVSSAGGVHGSLAFDNTAAVAAHVTGFPQESFTVEVFVKMPFVPPDAEAYQPQFALFSYGADLVGDADSGSAGDTTTFADNAILLQVLNQGGYIDTTRGFPEVKRLRGNLDVWINGRSRAGQVSESAEGIAFGRVVFDTPELADGEWHHLAVTWRFDDGLVRAYIDAREAATVAASRQTAQPGTRRAQDGALVLGQDQDCVAGCFDTNQALRGTLAEVRVWEEERSAEDIAKGMEWPWTRAPPEAMPPTLVARWSFDEQQRSGACIAGDGGAAQCIVSPSGGSAQGTELTIAAAAAPVRTLSDAPHQPLFLTLPENFRPGAEPSYAAGHAVHFQDGQALISASVAQFPTDAFTVEFWMRSSDKCRTGTPFSYSTGEYGVADNMLTVTNYNNWQIAIAEDQGSGQLTHGSLDDHSGLGSTHGDWTHVAVTWESVSGATHLYTDGRLVWSTIRARGKLIAGGGVLVLGREQDCAGGCFGKGPEADVIGGQGTGAQDFRGTLDEVRLWRVARTEVQIQAAMDEVSSAALAKDPNLVAYWPMDEGVGHVVRDITGHSNDLVLSRPDPTSWVVSTVTEKREERAKARGYESSKKHRKSATRRKHRLAHALLTTLTLLLMLAAAGAAVIWRRELGDACEPLAQHLADALHRLRGLFQRRGQQPAVYTSVDDWDIGEPEMASAEPFAAAAAYTPPPP